MLCPKCNGKTGVIDISHSEKTPENYRRRVCKKCGHTFYTVESVVKYDAKFDSQWRQGHRERKRRTIS